MAICPPSETNQHDELLYERYKSLWRRMEDYKCHIILLQNRIQRRDFEGLTFMSDEELQLTDPPPIIPRRPVNIDELKQMFPQIDTYTQDQIQSECELLSQRHSDEKREIQLQFARDYEEMEIEKEQVKADIERIEERDRVFDEAVSIGVNDMVTDFEEKNREANEKIAEAETIRYKADAHDQWEETKQRANTKRVSSNNMTEDVKQHIESILKDKFTFISSVVAFNNRAGNVRHLPYVPKGKVYWFSGDFSADDPVFHPSTREEFERNPRLYLNKPSH